MKKRLLSMTLAMAMTVGLLAGCSGGNGGSSGSGKSSSWKVTCPWAPSGVAALVSQKTAYEIQGSLVGSEMCIRDRHGSGGQGHLGPVSYTHLTLPTI